MCFINQKLEDDFLDPGECWRWLLRPNRLLKASEFSSPDFYPDYEKIAQDIESYTAWQTSFSKIHGLTLKLQLCGSN